MPSLWAQRAERKEIGGGAILEADGSNDDGASASTH